jgi:fatty acid desaturase
MVMTRGQEGLKQRLRTVAWRDLVPMRRSDGCRECLHPAPWLLGSWLFAGLAVWPLAIFCSFMFFLTALRLNHEAIHFHLGFARRGHFLVLHVLSALMLGSNSAVAFNHLQHHAHLGTPRDLEGKAGRMPFWRVLAYGPLFPIEMHLAAWQRGGPALRRRMRIDLLLNFGMLAATVSTASPVLVYHLLAMSCGQCLTAFFAVWITHHHCSDDALVARTQRARLVNFLSYGMFFHLEHHLFPAVPVSRLGRLAARLDAAVPELPASAKPVLALPSFAFPRRTDRKEPSHG